MTNPDRFKGLKEAINLVREAAEVYVTRMDEYHEAINSLSRIQTRYERDIQGESHDHQ